MKLPLIRVGITLALGSVVVSAMRFYVALAPAAADLNGPGIPATTRGLLDWFTHDFLFRGSAPSLLFWLGTLAATVGIVRMALPLFTLAEKRADPDAALAEEIARYHREQAPPDADAIPSDSDEPPVLPPPPDARRDPRATRDPGAERW